MKVAGQEAPLTPKEFDLLVFLVSNKGIALSREKILQKVWNYDYYGEDRTVDTHVKMLRSHLGPCRKYITTVWGIGYKFDPGYAMRKRRTHLKSPLPLSIRWQLMLFIGGITLFTRAAGVGHHHLRAGTAIQRAISAISWTPKPAAITAHDRPVPTPRSPTEDYLVPDS